MTRKQDAADKIGKIREFWDANPLWTGDAQSQGAAGSREFFESHTRAVLRESGGRMAAAFYPVCPTNAPILDLGCGIGFWLEQFGRRGFTNLTGADLSQSSLDLAQRRCKHHGIAGRFSLQNAQAMSFPDASFEHVQCTGVIHHSPNPQASVAEIHRVLAPGGRAVVSVYYRNFPLRHWGLIRPLGGVAMRLGLTPRGRGRDDMMATTDADDLVRRYDGAANPWGEAFTRRSFRDLFRQDWASVELFGYGFPARLLPFALRGAAFRTLERVCPFLIAAVATKKSGRE